MILEEGKVYENKIGVLFKIISINEGRCYPCQAEDGSVYKMSGHCYDVNTPSDRDLIKEASVSEILGIPEILGTSCKTLSFDTCTLLEQIGKKANEASTLVKKFSMDTDHLEFYPHWDEVDNEVVLMVVPFNNEAKYPLYLDDIRKLKDLLSFLLEEVEDA